MKALHCSDLMKGRGFVATGATEDEVMKKTAEHVKSAHNMHRLSPETALKLRQTIREEQTTRCPTLSSQKRSSDGDAWAPQEAVIDIWLLPMSAASAAASR